MLQSVRILSFVVAHYLDVKIIMCETCCHRKQSIITPIARRLVAASEASMVWAGW